MSIEKKDIESDKVERSTKIHTLSLRESDHVRVIANSIITAIERYIEYAKDLKQRIDLKDETLEITEYKQISGYIREKLRQAGVDEQKIRYVNEALEDYPEFKDHKYDKLTKGSVNRSLENLNPEVLDPFTQAENLSKVDDLDELYQQVKYVKDRIEKFADANNKPLVDHVERHKKISTPRLEPGESRMHFTGVQLKDSLVSLAEHFTVLLERINQYPPKDDEFDRHVMVRFEKVKTMVDNLDRYLQVLGDEKYRFSPVQMTVIDIGKETIGIPKHPDSLGSKITTLDGKPREMTDKNKRLRKKNYDELLNRFNNSVTDIEKMIREMVYDLSQWNDIKSDHAKAKATRQDRLHPTLSDKA